MNALSDALAGFAHAIVNGGELSREMDHGYPNYPGSVALGVYRNNYRGNLHDTLAGAYPVIEQLVGMEFFRQLTRKFIEAHPSLSGNLHHYGGQMAAFIAYFPPAQQLVYLPDVAALEWTCHRAYFADDNATLDIGKLAQVIPEQYPDLILQIHPACDVVHSRYPVAAIWHAHQPGAASDFHIDLNGGSCNALVFRREDVVQVRDLAEADAEWLSGIQSGSAFGAATAATLERHPDFDLQSALAELVSLGVFAGFNVRGQS